MENDRVAQVEHVKLILNTISVTIEQLRILRRGDILREVCTCDSVCSKFSEQHRGTVSIQIRKVGTAHHYRPQHVQAALLDEKHQGIIARIAVSSANVG